MPLVGDMDRDVFFLYTFLTFSQTEIFAIHGIYHHFSSVLQPSATALLASLRIPLIRVYNPLSSCSHLLPFGNTTLRNMLTQGTIGLSYGVKFPSAAWMKSPLSEISPFLAVPAPPC